MKIKLESVCIRGSSCFAYGLYRGLSIVRTPDLTRATVTADSVAG